MLMVRKPIPKALQFSLGIASILLLVGGYTVFSHGRAVRQKEVAAQQLDNVRNLLSEVLATPADELDPASLAKRQSKIHDYEAQITRFEQESQTAIDRTVPTWSSLYHDGLLRVLSPQGLKKDEYWLAEDAWATFIRLISGLGVGVALSLIIGILMGAYASIESFFLPPLSFLAKIPPTAMMAIFFILVGTSYQMYVTMIAFGVLPTLAQSIYQSAKKDVPENLIFKAYTLGASSLELIWNVIYKQILPRLIDAVRLQIGPAMVMLVAAEWMVSSAGFGYRLRLFYQRTDMTVIFVYVLILGVAGLAADYLLTLLRRKLCPWFGD